MLRRILFSTVPRANVLFNHNFTRRWCITTSSTSNEVQDFDAIDDFDAIKDPYNKKGHIPNDQVLKMLRQTFMHLFDCDFREANKLIIKHRNLAKVPLHHVSSNIEFLYDKKVSAKNIMDNGWLLGVTPSE